jgi:hypothetical protein
MPDDGNLDLWEQVGQVGTKPVPQVEGWVASRCQMMASLTSGSRLARLVPSQYPRWRAWWPLDAR